MSARKCPIGSWPWNCLSTWMAMTWSPSALRWMPALKVFSGQGHWCSWTPWRSLVFKEIACTKCYAKHYHALRVCFMNEYTWCILLYIYIVYMYISMALSSVCRLCRLPFSWGGWVDASCFHNQKLGCASATVAVNNCLLQHPLNPHAVPPQEMWFCTVLLSSAWRELHSGRLDCSFFGRFGIAGKSTGSMGGLHHWNHVFLNILMLEFASFAWANFCLAWF